MKKSLGFITKTALAYNKKDYPEDLFIEWDFNKKYIVFNADFNFSDWYKELGFLPVYLLDFEEEISPMSVGAIPYEINIFLREKIEKAIEKQFLCEPLVKDLMEMQHYDKKQIVEHLLQYGLLKEQIL